MLSSDSSSSNYGSERLFTNTKIRNVLTITLTPECANINVDYTSHIVFNNNDGSNSGFTQILKENGSEPENDIDIIVNVVNFNNRLSHFLLKYKNSLNYISLKRIITFF